MLIYGLRGSSAFAPNGREPWLLVKRESRRTVVVPQLNEPGSGYVVAPGVEVEEAAIAVASEALLVIPSRV
jgi:hypothetical protein